MEVKSLIKHVLLSGSNKVTTPIYLTFPTFRDIIKESNILQISFGENNLETLNSENEDKTEKNIFRFKGEKKLPKLRYFDYNINKNMRKTNYIKKEYLKNKNFKILEVLENSRKIKFDSPKHNINILKNFLFEENFEPTKNNSKIVILFLDRDISTLDGLKLKLNNKKFEKMTLNFYEKGGYVSQNITKDIALPTFNLYNINKKVLFDEFKNTIDVENLGGFNVVFGYIQDSIMAKRYSKSVHEYLPDKKLSRFINKKVNKIFFKLIFRA